jgi:hypothetical protein
MIRNPPSPQICPDQSAMFRQDRSSRPMPSYNLNTLCVSALAALLAGCAGAANGGALGEPVTVGAATPPPPAPTVVAQAQPAPSPAAAPATPAELSKQEKKERKAKKRKDKVDGLLSSNKPIQTGTMQPDGTYKLSAAELELSCKKLTGRAFVRILQIRDHQISQQATPVARGAQQIVTPIFGGSRHGIDPDADYRRDRAMIEAYNQRLGEKRCKVFDLVKELQPKPAGESPTLVKR